MGTPEQDRLLGVQFGNYSHPFKSVWVWHQRDGTMDIHGELHGKGLSVNVSLDRYFGQVDANLSAYAEPTDEDRLREMFGVAKAFLVD